MTALTNGLGPCTGGLSTGRRARACPAMALTGRGLPRPPTSSPSGRTSRAGGPPIVAPSCGRCTPPGCGGCSTTRRGSCPRWPTRRALRMAPCGRPERWPGPPSRGRTGGSSAVAARSPTPRHRKTCICCGSGARSCATRWRCSRRCSTTPPSVGGRRRTGDARRGTVLVDGTVCPTSYRRHVPGVVAHVTGLIGPSHRSPLHRPIGVRRGAPAVRRAVPGQPPVRSAACESAGDERRGLGRSRPDLAGLPVRAWIRDALVLSGLPLLNGRRTPRRTSGSSRLTRSRRCRYVAAVQGSAAPPTGGSASIGVLPWEQLFLRPRHRTAS